MLAATGGPENLVLGVSIANSRFGERAETAGSRIQSQSRSKPKQAGSFVVAAVVFLVAANRGLASSFVALPTPSALPRHVFRAFLALGGATSGVTLRRWELDAIVRWANHAAAWLPSRR